jgi:hypothetical protein
LTRTQLPSRYPKWAENPFPPKADASLGCRVQKMRLVSPLHGPRTLRASRVLARILDHRKPFDYLWLMALAALPIGLAWSIGAHRGPPGGFQGYWERIQWPLWVIILPIAAFYLRWMAKQIGPVLPRELPSPPPPIIDLIKTKEAAYADLRIALLGPANLFAALLMTFVFHVVDMAQIGGIYISGVTQVCRSEAPPTAGALASGAATTPSTTIVASTAVAARTPAPQGATERAAAPCAQLYDPDGTLPRLSVPFLGWRFESGADWPVAYLRPGARGPSKGRTWRSRPVPTACSLQGFS